MEFLKRILDYVDDNNARNMVNDINSELEQYEKEGYISEEERDALRHYFGIKKLSSEYGETIGWLAGLVHENMGANLLLPENNPKYIDSKIDLYNNNIALEHYRSNTGINFEDIETINDIRKPLEHLKIITDISESQY